MVHGHWCNVHHHVDSGILKNISNKSNFSSSVLVGDESSIPVSKVGHSTLLHPNPYHTLVLKNVFITPQIIKNHIYICQFKLENKCTIEFYPYGFSVKDL